MCQSKGHKMKQKQGRWKVQFRNKLCYNFKMARKTLKSDEYSVKVINVFRSCDSSNQWTHVWFLKGNTSILSMVADFRIYISMLCWGHIGWIPLWKTRFHFWLIPIQNISMWHEFRNYITLILERSKSNHNQLNIFLPSL